MQRNPLILVQEFQYLGLCCLRPRQDALVQRLPFAVMLHTNFFP